jgi:uncharacterized membrane protein
MGENQVAPEPTALYGVVMLGAGLAYRLLQSFIIRLHGPDCDLAKAVGRDMKGKLSHTLYALAIPLAFVNRWISVAIYVFVALMWLIPDPRIESRTKH